MHAKLSKVNVPPFPVPDDYGSVKLNAKAVNFNQMDDDWFDVSKFGWSDIQFESLKRIKEYCHMHNIRLIFLIPAKRKDFSNLATTKFKNENTYWWHRINEIAGGEYVIGNYRCLDACNQDSIFAEAFHLNMEGQKYFSKYVKDRLDSPGVISEHYSFD